jgi:hypothetical protein
MQISSQHVVFMCHRSWNCEVLHATKHRRQQLGTPLQLRSRLCMMAGDKKVAELEGQHEKHYEEKMAMLEMCGWAEALQAGHTTRGHCVFALR